MLWREDMSCFYAVSMLDRQPRQTTSPSAPSSTQQRLHIMAWWALLLAEPLLNVSRRSLSSCCGAWMFVTGDMSHSSASFILKDCSTYSSSSFPNGGVWGSFCLRHSRMQTKQVCSWHDWHLAKESRSDFLVGRRWQTWQGIMVMPPIFTGPLQASWAPCDVVTSSSRGEAFRQCEECVVVSLSSWIARSRFVGGSVLRADMPSAALSSPVCWFKTWKTAALEPGCENRRASLPSWSHLRFVVARWTSSPT